MPALRSSRMNRPAAWRLHGRGWNGRLVRAFTLLELLVSITIIAVLLAIALPALRSVRRAATDHECQTRLASLGAAYNLYATEHNDRWATLDYPLRLDGSVDVLRTPTWGGSYWFVLPVNEMTFWGFPLRNYVSENSDTDIIRTIEALSCPTHFDQWFDDLPPEQRSGHEAVSDPMQAPQESYYHSLALLTSPSGWGTSTAVPNINQCHAPVQMSAVAHPSRKAALVEKWAFHDDPEQRIESATTGRFNILAADGHVEKRFAQDAAEPAGFVAQYTGMEIPLQDPDQHAKTGIRYVSTRKGALGRDW